MIQSRVDPPFRARNLGRTRCLPQQLAFESAAELLDCDRGLLGLFLEIVSFATVEGVQASYCIREELRSVGL